MPKSSFFSPRRLALLAMLTAASIVLSRLCVISPRPFGWSSATFLFFWRVCSLALPAGSS